MNIWHDIDPALITPDRFMAVIEIKRGGKNKGDTGGGENLSPMTEADIDKAISTT